MNAKARAARQIIKARRSGDSYTAKPHTLNSWLMAAGADTKTASGVSGALRSACKRTGVTGRAARLFRRNAAGQKMWRKPVAGGRRYSAQEVLVLASVYRPRLEQYKAAKAAVVGYIEWAQAA